MYLRSLPLLALLLTPALPAAASTVLGSPVCIDYHSAYTDPERKTEALSYQSWLLGFLSGLTKGAEMLAQDGGKERFPGEFDVLAEGQAARLTQLADRYCQQYPDKKLHSAAILIFQNLLDEHAQARNAPANPR